MITVVLSGGLGNQMFQYAAGRALSIELDTGMSIDLYKIRKKSTAIRRNYQLDVFNTSVKIIRSKKVKFITKAFAYINNSSAGKKLLKAMHVFKDEYSYDTRFENLDNNTILYGYFQNEKYFEKYRDQIRKDFTFKLNLDNKNKDILDTIKQSESVSIHVRRGDYTSVFANLELLDIEYYRNAINYIADRVNNPSFYVFSDDILWARQNLNLGDFPCKYIDWNQGDKSYIDMQLMSCCKHNIIANSSFSWWGAWLNSNEDKIVIVPSAWYKDQISGEYADGFIPEKWISLKKIYA